MCVFVFVLVVCVLIRRHQRPDRQVIIEPIKGFRLGGGGSDTDTNRRDCTTVRVTVCVGCMGGMLLCFVCSNDSRHVGWLVRVMGMGREGKKRRQKRESRRRRRIEKENRTLQEEREGERDISLCYAPVLIVGVASIRFDSVRFGVRPILHCECIEMHPEESGVGG